MKDQKAPLQLDPGEGKCWVGIMKGIPEQEKTDLRMNMMYLSKHERPT